MKYKKEQYGVADLKYTTRVQCETEKYKALLCPESKILEAIAHGDSTLLHALEGIDNALTAGAVGGTHAEQRAAQIVASFYGAN